MGPKRRPKMLKAKRGAAVTGGRSGSGPNRVGDVIHTNPVPFSLPSPYGFNKRE